MCHYTRVGLEHIEGGVWVEGFRSYQQESEQVDGGQ